MEAWFPLLAQATLSVATIVAAYFFATRALKYSLKPYIIFYNATEFDVSKKTSWVVENSGNGPAINVTVTGDKDWVISSEAVSAVLPSISKGASHRLEWMPRRDILVATYEDVFGNWYTTTTVNNRTTFCKGNLYPNLRGLSVFQLPGYLDEKLKAVTGANLSKSKD